MLEDCPDLPAYEIILSEAVKSIRLLGEIPLSDRDVETLANSVRQKITPNISRGTTYLKTKTPTCFVCFLVGMGRYYDKQAGFWPIVEDKVGIIDLNWKVKWGKIFLKYLENHDLPRFDEEEGLAYVTPILGHACLPDCCLDEFFDRVLDPLIKHDLLNPLDQQEIIHDLGVRRKINESRLELEKKRREHNEWLKVLQQGKRGLRIQIKKYEEVATLLAEEEECERRKIALHGLEGTELTRSNLLSHINEDNDKIQRLESEGKKLWGRITSFRRRYQPVMEVKPQIDDVMRNHTRFIEELPEALENEKQQLAVVNTEWAKYSREPWHDSFGVEILQLPLEQLLSQIEQFQCLKEKLKTIQDRIRNLEASQKEAKKPSPLISFFQSLIRKILIRVGRKNPVPQPSELQQLLATYREVELQLHLQQDRIKELFKQLPVEKLLLDNLTLDLHKELCSLKLMCVSFLDARDKRIKLDEEKGQLIEQVRDLSSSLGIAVDGNLNTRVNRLGEILKEAQQSQTTALEVKRILEKENRPALEAVRLEHQRLHADLEKLDKQLSELGDSSTQQGLGLVQEFQRFRAEVANTRQILSSRYSDLLFTEAEIRNKGLDNVKRDLEEVGLEIDTRIQAAKSELEHIEQGFGSYPAQYFSVDEPIRRFLLYGGIIAEIYLTDSILLFARAKSSEKIEDVSDLHLPNRIIQHFQEWWEKYRPNGDEGPNPKTGERFRSPQIFFDVAVGEIIAELPSQRLLRPNHETIVQLDIFNADSSNPFHTTSLKLYNRSKGFVETHSENIVLTAPFEKYIFRLKSKDNLIRRWEIQGISAGATFLAFSSSSHYLIKGENLPRSQLIIVVNNKLKIFPQDCVLTEAALLYGGWREYAWYEVDLSRVVEFCLKGQGGQCLPIQTSEVGSGITLIGGNKLAGVLSDERPVFDSPPEFIRVPINNRDELHLLRFSLFFEDENRTRKSKHYQFDELVNILNIQNDGCIDIPLYDEQLLGASSIGCFTLRVYKPRYLDWQTSFCIIPLLNVSFDKEMYLPYRREKATGVIVTLTLPENSKFTPDDPAKVISRDEAVCEVQAPASENEVTGWLLCSIENRERNNIPITFSIPKIRWRLKGLDDPQYDHWIDEIKEELWIGDWIKAQELFLVIETPWSYTGEVSLVLPGNSISREIGKVYDQKVRIDLKALEDALRRGPSLETVSIFLKDTQTKIPNIPLFTVRTCWLAEKIRCFHYPEGDTIRLDVSWKEKGKANQKVARLWYLSGDRPRLIQEQMVPQDIQEVTFRSTSTEVKSGKYLVHLEPFDPWSSKPVCPKPNDPNSVIIEIVTKTPEKAITIRSVCVDKHHSYALPQGSYRIHIIGKVINQKFPDDLEIEDIDHVLITPLNENWYVGNLEVKGIPEVIMHLSDTNPVKFEYDSQKHIVTSIEDRHGDGSVYCYECKMLFWYQGTVLNEKKKNHRNYGPIEEFWVVWESG